MTSRRVAACVVTGFLGSGKTTLIRSLVARDPAPERIAIVVNELGEIGIDGRVLGGFESIESVVELSSGCICCSIDEYRFDMAVDELVRRLDPLLLVVETTGVADPAPAVERLQRCGIGVDAVTTVVDATSWRVALAASRTARRQIDAADFLVLSKTDLAGAAQTARLRRRLAAWNPRAVLLEGRPDGLFDGAELLLATTAAQKAREAKAPEVREAQKAREAKPAPPVAAAAAPSHLADIESVTWTSPVPVDRRRFEEALRRLPREVVRAKGFLRDPDERQAWLFHLVCGRTELTILEAPPPIASGVQAVFLGSGIAARRDEIVAALESPAGRPAEERMDRLGR